MKKTKVTIPWQQGLHTRPAAKLVHLAKRHNSSIRITANGKIADAQSIIAILLLCATFGAMLDVEIHGEDEGLATAAIEQFFMADDTVPDTITVDTVRGNEQV